MSFPPVPHSTEGDNLPHFERCASCRSDCTKLVQSQTYGLPPKPVYTCADRTLCKDIMIMEHMIANVRSTP